MKEKMLVDAQGGGTLEVRLGGRLVGQALTIPADVTSLTIVIKDTQGLMEDRARRREKQSRGKRGGGRGRNRDLAD